MRRLKFILIGATLAAVIGCASIQKKNQELVNERVARLVHLNSWEPTLCRLTVTPTQSASARFQQMFPQVEASESWDYTWKAREVACEVHPHKSNAVTEEQKTFLETAFCLLLQTHFVNSPFDELKVQPEQIVGHDGQVQIQPTANPDLGIFLDRASFQVETKTKSRGVLLAEYKEVNGRWLPTRLVHSLGDVQLVLDELAYEAGARQSLKEFWLFIGNEQALRHSKISISDCKHY